MRRREATIDEWRALYHSATQLGEMKPWLMFWDMDTIVLQFSNEDPVYFSILGRNQQTYGISAYEGNRGLASFQEMAEAGNNPLVSRYVTFNQQALCAYWGNRDEVSKENDAIIKELGYEYYGTNQWLYLLSLVPGYYPYHLNQDEVQRLTRYYKKLIDALVYYQEKQMAVSFDDGQAFWYMESSDKKSWEGLSKDLPLVFGSVPYLGLNQNPELKRQLRNADHSGLDIQADMVHLAAYVTDESFDRPIMPLLFVLVDGQSGMVLKTDLLKPSSDQSLEFLDVLIDYFLESGIPLSLHLRHESLVRLLDPLAEETGIELLRSDDLPELDHAAMMLLHQIDGLK